MFKNYRIGRYVKRLSHADEHIRNAAVEGLCRYESIDHITAALYSGYSDVRIAAVGALANLRAVEHIIVALGNNHSDVREAAIAALAKLREVDQLVKIVNDKISRLLNPDVGFNSIIKLGEVGDRRAIALLIDILGIGGLGETHHLAVTEARVLEIAAREQHGLLSESNAKAYRKVAAEALAKIGEPKWLQWVRGNAYDFFRLAKSGDDEVLKPLLIGLEEGPELTRAAAADCLGLLKSPEVIKPLLLHLTHGDVAHISEMCAMALAKIGDPAVDPLIAALETAVQNHAITALSLIGSDYCIKEVVNILSHPKGEVRKAAIIILGNMENSLVIKPLVKMLQDSNEEVKRTAAYSLAKLKSPHSYEPLINLLKTNKLGAINGFKELGDIRAVEPLLKILTEYPDRYVRLSVVKTLKILGRPEWSEWFHGDNDDCIRFIRSRHPLSIDMLTKTDINEFVKEYSELQMCSKMKKLKEIVERLIDLQDRRVIPRLRDILYLSGHCPNCMSNSKDCKDLVKSVVLTLEHFGGSDSVTVLTGYLELRDEMFRYKVTAISSLGNLGDKRAVAPIREYFLSHCQISIERAIMARSLAQLGETQWSQWIKGDDEDYMRLGRSRDSRAFEILKNLLNAYDHEVRIIAASAIIELIKDVPDLSCKSAEIKAIIEGPYFSTPHGNTDY